MQIHDLLVAAARVQHLAQQIGRAHVFGMRGVKGARGRFGAVEIAGVALRLRQQERHPEVVGRRRERLAEDVARLAGMPGVDERGRAARRDLACSADSAPGPRPTRRPPPATRRCARRARRAARVRGRTAADRRAAPSASRPRRRAPRRFLRLGQQHRPFGILRLFDDDAAEERDGVGGTILSPDRAARA